MELFPCTWHRSLWVYVAYNEISRLSRHSLKQMWNAEALLHPAQGALCEVKRNLQTIGVFKVPSAKMGRFCFNWTMVIWAGHNKIQRLSGYFRPKCAFRCWKDLGLSYVLGLLYYIQRILDWINQAYNIQYVLKVHLIGRPDTYACFTTKLHTRTYAS